MIYRVECYSGTKYGERPTALLSDQARLEVVEILKRWRSPTSICFQVLTTNGQSFELIYDENSEHWGVREI